jgi:hypothetical protein
LKIEHIIESREYNDPVTQVQPILFGVRNMGAGIAIHVGVGMRIWTNFESIHKSVQRLNDVEFRHFQPGYPEGHKQRASEEREISFFAVGSGNHVVYPNTAFYIARVNFYVPAEAMLARGIKVAGECELHCEGFSGVETFELVMPPQIHP